MHYLHQILGSWIGSEFKASEFTRQAIQVNGSFELTLSTVHTIFIDKQNKDIELQRQHQLDFLF